MGLDSAHKGYEYQDLLSAYFVITEMLNSNKATFKIDKKESENDKFDDLTIITEISTIKRQIKYSEEKTLEKADLSTNSYDLALDILFNSWKETGQAGNTELRLCLAWDIPSEKEVLDILLATPTEDEYGTGLVSFFKIDVNNIWKEGELPNSTWRRLRDKSKNIDRAEFATFLEKLVIEVNLPKASLDVNNPGELEQLVISRLEDFGVGKYPNHKKPVIDVLLMLTHIIKNARAKGKILHMQEIIYQLGLQNNFGNIEQVFQIEQAINVINNKFEEFYNIVNENSRVVLLGEPGSGKSWFIQNFINYLQSKSVKIVRHYCYTGINDIYERERITINIFLANIINDIISCFPTLGKVKQTKYGVDIDELQSLLNSIEDETILIIDGLDHIGRIYSLHREIIREVDTQIIKVISELKFSDKVKVILASQPVEEVSSLKDNDYLMYDIPNWELDEISMLMKKHNISEVKLSYTKNLSEVIHNKSNGNPLYATYLINEIKNRSISSLTLSSIEEFPAYSRNLVGYYEYLMSKLREDERIAMILAGAPFYLNEEELHNITGLGKYVGKSIKILKSILKVNQCTGGYTIYHESFRRFIIERLIENEICEEIIYHDIISWLDKKGFYNERKSYNNLLLLLFESNKLEEIQKYINIDFVIQSMFHGNPIKAIAKNFEILIKAASKLNNFDALIICTEIGSMLYSLEYSFDENSELYYKCIGYVHSFSHLKELLVYDGSTTLGFKEGLRACYLCSENSVIPDWEPYINLFRELADKKTRNDPQYFRYYICALIDNNKALSDILIRISDEEFDEYRNVVIDEFNRRDNIEGLYELIALLPKKDIWNISIKSYFGEYDYNLESINNSIQGLKKLSMISESNIQLLSEYVRHAKSFVKHNKALAEEFVNEIKDKNWFYNWLIFIMKINEVINEIEDKNVVNEEKLVDAYAWLIKDTAPFKGEPRACDLYFGRGIIYDSIRAPLKYIRTKVAWEKVSRILSIVSDDTTTSFQGSISGPLSTDKMLELLIEVLDENNSEIVEENYIKTIKDEENHRLYTYLADYSMKLAILYKRVGKTAEAYNEFSKGIHYLVSYSFRKDRTLSRLLNCITNIYKLDNETGIEYAKKLKQLADAVIHHTDGRDTSSYPHEWFTRLIKIDLKTALLYLKTELTEKTCYWILENSLESLLIHYKNQISPKIENILYRTLPSVVTDEFVMSYLENIEWLIDSNEIQLAKISISELINRFANDSEPYINDENIVNKIRCICDSLMIEYSPNIYKKYNRRSYQNHFYRSNWVNDYNKNIAVRKNFDEINEEELLFYLKNSGFRDSDFTGLYMFLERYTVLDEKSKRLIKGIIEICNNSYSKENSSDFLAKVFEISNVSDSVKAYAFMYLYITHKDGWYTRFNRVDFFKKAFDYDIAVAQECFFNYTYYNFGDVEYTLAVGDKIINALIAINYDKEKILQSWSNVFNIIDFRLPGQYEYNWRSVSENSHEMDNEELLVYILLSRLRYGEAIRQKWVFSGLDIILKNNDLKQKFVKPLLHFIDNIHQFSDYSMIVILKLVQKYFTKKELDESGINEKLQSIYPRSNELINHLIREIMRIEKIRIYVPYDKKTYNQEIKGYCSYMLTVDSRLRELKDWGINVLGIIDTFIKNVSHKGFVEKYRDLIYNEKYSTFIQNSYFYDNLLKSMANEVDAFLNLNAGEDNLHEIERELFELILDDIELIIAQQNSIIPRPAGLSIPAEISEGIFELDDSEWVIVAQYEEQIAYKREYARAIDPDNLERIRNFSGLAFNIGKLMLPYLKMPDDYKFFSEYGTSPFYLFSIPEIDGVIASNISLHYDIQLNFNNKLLLWIQEDVMNRLNIKKSCTENGIVGLDENGEVVLSYSWWQTYYFFTEGSNDMIPYLTGSQLLMRVDKYRELCKIARGIPEYHKYVLK